MKILENNTGEKLDDLGFGREISDMTPKAQSTKERTDKLDFIKIKNLSFAKNTIKRTKRPTIDGKKYFQKTHLIKD